MSGSVSSVRRRVLGVMESFLAEGLIYPTVILCGELLVNPSYPGKVLPASARCNQLGCIDTMSSSGINGFTWDGRKRDYAGQVHGLRKIAGADL